MKRNNSQDKLKYFLWIFSLMLLLVLMVFNRAEAQREAENDFHFYLTSVHSLPSNTDDSTKLLADIYAGDLYHSPARSDAEIAYEIKQVLRSDLLVDQELFTFQVKNGIVYLSGVVADDLERKIIIHDVQVAGVQKVSARELKVIQPSYSAGQAASALNPTDKEIEQAITIKLTTDPRVNYTHLDLIVSHGKVVLYGQVEKLLAKQVAQQKAEDTEGVWTVLNLIRVSPNVMTQDSSLLQKVTYMLNHHAYLAPFEIRAEVENGVVSLNGVVDPSFEKEKAFEVISGIEGVKEIIDHILTDESLAPDFEEDALGQQEIPQNQPDFEALYSQKSQDQETKTQIEKQLQLSPYVNAEKIVVRVDNGKAILSGVVGSRSAKRSAEMNAYQGGAKEVENQLTISTQETN